MSRKVLLRYDVCYRGGRNHGVALEKQKLKNEYRSSYWFTHRHGNERITPIKDIDLAKAAIKISGLHPFTAFSYDDVDHLLGLYYLVTKHKTRKSNPHLRNILDYYPRYRQVRNLNDLAQDLGSPSLPS